MKTISMPLDEYNAEIEKIKAEAYLSGQQDIMRSTVDLLRQGSLYGFPREIILKDHSRVLPHYLRQWLNIAIKEGKTYED